MTTPTAAATTTWWLAPAIIAALVTLVAGIVTLIVNGRRARVDRQRVVFAAANADLAAYREFVYIVRRRRHDQPEAERVRISGELSAVQSRLNQNAAVLKVEAPRVADAYDELLRITRRVAGGAIRDGWDTPPITADTDIHVDLDLSAIDPCETAYLLEQAPVRRVRAAHRARYQRGVRRRTSPRHPAVRVAGRCNP
ncbi:MAG: hypothetical protein ACRD29_14430 [Acidimicrobiales bacterium]